MKRITKSAMSLLLAFVLLFQVGEAGFVFAAEEIDKQINPTDHIELTVPEQYQNGENLFFREPLTTAMLVAAAAVVSIVALWLPMTEEVEILELDGSSEEDAEADDSPSPQE